MEKKVSPTEDGMMRVCVEEDGFEACGWVSSWHLAEPKANQLREAVRKMAEEAILRSVTD